MSSDSIRDTRIGSIPEEWDLKPLNKIASIFSSNVDKKSYQDEIPIRLCNYLDIYNNEYIDSSINFMKATATAREIEKFHLQRYDVLITKDSETAEDIAVSAVIIENLKNVICGYHLALIRPKVEQINGIFLSKLFSSYPIRSQYSRLSNGLTRFGLTIGSIENSVLPVPPLPEQRKIAEILYTVDEAIEKTDRIIEETRQLKKGLMQKLFTEGIGHTRFKDTKIGRIPEAWKVINIGSCILDFRGGASLTPSDFISYGVKVLPKMGVVPGGVLNIPKNKQQYCSMEYSLKNNKSMVDKAFIIVVLRDLVPSGPNIGLIVNIKSDENYILAQGVYGLRLKEQIIKHKYLVQLSNSIWYRKYMQRILVGSTQVHITNTEFRKVLIPLPPINEQIVISEIITCIEEKIKQEEATKTQLEELKRGLMQVLLTGKVRVKA